LRDSLLASTVSKISIFYGVLWLLSVLIQNTIYSTVISGFGVILLIVVAIGLAGVFGENDENNLKFKIEIENLHREINELKEIKKRL
jgi:hypothetical protein